MNPRPLWLVAKKLDVILPGTCKQKFLLAISRHKQPHIFAKNVNLSWVPRFTLIKTCNFWIIQRCNPTSTNDTTNSYYKNHLKRLKLVQWVLRRKIYYTYSAHYQICYLGYTMYFHRPQTFLQTNLGINNFSFKKGIFSWTFKS